MTPITQNNTSLKAILYMQNYKTNQENILYAIKTQKRAEPKVDKSVLKTSRCTKQWSVNHTIQYTITFHQDIHLTTRIYTLHPTLP